MAFSDLDRRLKAVESYAAESRDDNDLIRLSEITERIQEIAHTLEIMSNKIEGLNNRIQATNRLLLAIGAAVVVLVLAGLWQ